jgi:hypothetical protein
MYLMDSAVARLALGWTAPPRHARVDAPLLYTPQHQYRHASPISSYHVMLVTEETKLPSVIDGASNHAGWTLLIEKTGVASKG